MKKSGWKKLLSLVLCFVLVLGFAVNAAPSYAGSEKEEELEDLQKQIEEMKDQIRANESALTELQQEIRLLEVEIFGVQKEIDIYTRQINATKAKISEKLEELDKKQVEITEQNVNLNARLRAMYKSGNAGILSVLLNSASISELLTNIEMAKRIYAADSDLLQKLHAEYEVIYQMKVELTQLKDSLQAEQDVVKDKKADLVAKEKAAQAKRDAVEKSNEELAAQLRAMEKDADELIEIIRREQSSKEYGGGDMCWPSASSKRITEYFGQRAEPIPGVSSNHKGIDIGAAKGTQILAANSGKVIAAGYKPSSYGNYLMIDHGGKIVTLYGHASKLLVKEGDVVKRGQVIALVGSTGASTGPHLHFEVRVNGVYKDPLDYVVPGRYIID